MIPPDTKRCQAERPNGHHFMTLGGRPGRRERCTNAPTTVVHEVKPGSDGQMGGMSICGHCLTVFLNQVPNAHAHKFVLVEEWKD